MPLLESQLEDEMVGLLERVPAPVTHLDKTALEWEPLLALVAGYAISRVGREGILVLMPSTDQAWIEQQHRLTGEVRGLLSSAVSIPLGGLFDPTQLAAKAQIPGAALEPEEFQAIARLAHDIAGWQGLLLNPPPSVASKIGGLMEMAGALTQGIAPLAEAIQRKLNPDGSLADDASPELSRIRQEQQRQQRVIEESLRSALRKLSADSQTQDDLITIRGDRFVIPVKAEQKRRVSGVVHGASSSGQTVYVEPLETIEQNNELVRMLEEEQAEIHRIFIALTRLVGGYAETLVAGARVLAVVDTLQARARFGIAYDCVQPVFSEELFRLEAARHPLLEKRLRAAGGSIIPFTLQLESDARQLIISGPNTGGKTVTLKTTALCALMAQSGIPVPAAAATMPVFEAFLADIGDAQSIERALSTFSAHIVNLDRISHLASGPAGPHALILLDELGSATDPDEGSALAVAVAEFFLKTRAWSLISTHHTSLKIYAVNTPGVVNAAAGVDEVTLVPNYQLRLGVPGASAGIQTAERLGLNAAIVAGARAKMGTQQADIGRFLQNLHTQLRELEADRKAAREEKYALNTERAKLVREGDVEVKRRTRELEQKLGSLLKDFEFQMRQTVQAIEDRAGQLKLSKESERRIQRLRRDFEEQFNSTVVAHKHGADVGDANAQPHVVKHVAVGDQVRVKSMNKVATIVREVDKDFYEVSLGALKMRIRRDDVAEVVARAGKPLVSEKPLDAVARQKGVRVTVTSSGSEDMRSEINLIGRTVDEATTDLERYLDQAFLAGLQQVRVIHGTGMGVLRRALREYLRKHPHVARIEEPTHQEGGAGATVVELRQ
jgi:DNA mismatch repair protein MutS2